MKKIIREQNGGIIQITVSDERWYAREVVNEITGLPEFKYVPSVTWIAHSYPKGIGFYKWLADKGWEESQALKTAAGDKGSKVHTAISDILKGNEVRIDSKYLNNSTNELEELTLEECDCILSFVKWYNDIKPETIAFDYTIYHDGLNYAGSIDYVCKIGEDYWLIDFKTSQEVWSEFELQVSAYKKGLDEGFHSIENLPKGTKINLGILQIGYRKNKARYKWNVIEDKFPLFLAARQIWENEHSGEFPSKRDYPIILSPGRKLEGEEGEKVKKVRQKAIKNNKK